MLHYRHCYYDFHSNSICIAQNSLLSFVWRGISSANHFDAYQFNTYLKAYRLRIAYFVRSLVCIDTKRQRRDVIKRDAFPISIILWCVCVSRDLWSVCECVCVHDVLLTPCLIHMIFFSFHLIFFLQTISLHRSTLDILWIKSGIHKSIFSSFCLSLGLYGAHTHAHSIVDFEFVSSSQSRCVWTLALLNGGAEWLTISPFYRSQHSM